MDWITDQIAIGNYRDAVSLPADIEALLCLKADCCDEGREDVEVLCIPLVDGPGNDLRDVREGVRFIADVVSAGGRILVHCHAGRSRSVAVVARYLVESRGMTRRAALALISAKREIYLSDGIDEVLGP
ncbi:putative Dual specificity protein phosphatase [Thiocapsa sp. KS1]|nr:dual specificity protein phosphatase [Thiocapsa sp. KS1]CRI67816.1 putative Dual specificity protein phosphatase [Thiocapsa sp. KS1]